MGVYDRREYDKTLKLAQELQTYGISKEDHKHLFNIITAQEPILNESRGLGDSRSGTKQEIVVKNIVSLEPKQLDVLKAVAAKYHCTEVGKVVSDVQKQREEMNKPKEELTKEEKTAVVKAVVDKFQREHKTIAKKLSDKIKDITHWRAKVSKNDQSQSKQRN